MVDITFGADLDNLGEAPPGPAGPQVSFSEELFPAPKTEPETTQAAGPDLTTAPAPTGGEKNPIAEFFMNSDTDLAAYLTMSNLPGIGPAINNVLPMTQKEPDTPAEAATLLATDRALFGAADTLMAGRAKLSALQQGATMEEAREAADNMAASVRQNYELTRAAYPKSALVGDTLGAVIAGVPTAMAGTALTGSTILLGAGTAAADEFIYKLNSDGSLSEATYDAAGAAVVGAMGAALFKSMGIAGRLVFGKGKDRYMQEIGSEIVGAVQAKHALETGEQLSRTDALNMIEQMGPDKVIADMYPELHQRMFLAAAVDNPTAVQRARDFLASRNRAQFNYRQTVLDTVNDVRTPRTPMAFQQHVKDVQTSLQPRYTELYRRMDDMKWGVPKTNVRTAILRQLDNKASNFMEDQKFLKNLVEKNINEKTLKVDPTGGKFKFREVHQMLKEVNEAIYKRQKYNKSESTPMSLPMENLFVAKKYLKGLLDQSEDFKKFQATYADMEVSKKGYEFGRKLMKSKDIFGSDAQIWLRNNNSAGAFEALVEGARFELYTGLRNRTTDQGAAFLKTEAKLDDLRTLIGGDAVDQMVKNVQDVVNYEKSIEATSKGLSSRSSPGTDFLGQRIMDIRTSAEGVKGGASGVAPMFAMRRLLAAAVDGAPKPLASELRRMADVNSGAMFTKEGGEEAVRAFLNQADTVPRAALGGAASGGAFSDSQAAEAGSQALEKAVATGKDAYQAIRDMLIQ